MILQALHFFFLFSFLLTIILSWVVSTLIFDPVFVMCSAAVLFGIHFNRYFSAHKLGTNQLRLASISGIIWLLSYYLSCILLLVTSEYYLWHLLASIGSSSSLFSTALLLQRRMNEAKLSNCLNITAFFLWSRTTTVFGKPKDSTVFSRGYWISFLQSLPPLLRFEPQSPLTFELSLCSTT